MTKYYAFIVINCILCMINGYHFKETGNYFCLFAQIVTLFSAIYYLLLTIDKPSDL